MANITRFGGASAKFEGDATPEDVAFGKTFYGDSKEMQVGTRIIYNVIDLKGHVVWDSVEKIFYLPVGYKIKNLITIPFDNKYHIAGFWGNPGTGYTWMRYIRRARSDDKRIDENETNVYAFDYIESSTNFCPEELSTYYKLDGTEPPLPPLE